MKGWQTQPLSALGARSWDDPLARWHTRQQRIYPRPQDLYTLLGAGTCSAESSLGSAGRDSRCVTFVTKKQNAQSLPNKLLTYRAVFRLMTTSYGKMLEPPTRRHV